MNSNAVQLHPVHLGTFATAQGASWGDEYAPKIPAAKGNIAFIRVSVVHKLTDSAASPGTPVITYVPAGLKCGLQYGDGLVTHNRVMLGMMFRDAHLFAGTGLPTVTATAASIQGAHDAQVSYDFDWLFRNAITGEGSHPLDWIADLRFYNDGFNAGATLSHYQTTIDLTAYMDVTKGRNLGARRGVRSFSGVSDTFNLLAANRGVINACTVFTNANTYKPTVTVDGEITGIGATLNAYRVVPLDFATSVSPFLSGTDYGGVLTYRPYNTDAARTVQIQMDQPITAAFMLCETYPPVRDAWEGLERPEVVEAIRRAPQHVLRQVNGGKPVPAARQNLVSYRYIG